MVVLLQLRNGMDVMHLHHGEAGQHVIIILRQGIVVLGTDIEHHVVILLELNIKMEDVLPLMEPV
jgi:hypothetical protein